MGPGAMLERIRQLKTAMLRARRRLADRERIGARSTPAPGGEEIAAFQCPIIKPKGQEHIFENKLHNLALALASVDGLVLAPGGVFSFWSVVGEPSLLRGYREGPAFIQSRVASNIGG